MKPELRSKIIAFNRAVNENRGKASDLDILVFEIAMLPHGQLKKVLSEEVIIILEKHGLHLE